MKTFLYIKASVNPTITQKKIAILETYVAKSGDEAFAICVNSKVESLVQKDGKCSLLELMLHQNIKKLVVLDIYDLSLNPDDIYEFNYQLYNHEIKCELVTEKQTLQEWVIDQKMYADEEKEDFLTKHAILT